MMAGASSASTGGGAMMAGASSASTGGGAMMAGASSASTGGGAMMAGASSASTGGGAMIGGGAIGPLGSGIPAFGNEGAGILGGSGIWKLATSGLSVGGVHRYARDAATDGVMGMPSDHLTVSIKR